MVAKDLVFVRVDSFESFVLTLLLTTFNSLVDFVAEAELKRVTTRFWAAFDPFLTPTDFRCDFGGFTASSSFSPISRCDVDSEKTSLLSC